MKLNIKIAAQYTVHKLPDGLYLTLAEYPPKDLTRASIRKVPYIQFDLNFVWDKGTVDEAVEPNMLMISVLTRLQRRGLAALMLTGLLDYMKKKRIKYMRFSSQADRFWQRMAIRMKDNVTMSKRMRGKIGIFHVKGFDLSSILV